MSFMKNPIIQNHINNINDDSCLFTHSLDQLLGHEKKIVLFINPQKFSRSIREQIDCRDRFDRFEIIASIKYLEIISFFDKQFRKDYDYYKHFFSEQVILTGELHNSLKRFDKLLEIDKGLKSFRIIEDNINPHDPKVEQAYQQLLEISNQLFDSLGSFLVGGVSFLRNDIEVDLENKVELGFKNFLIQYIPPFGESKIKYFKKVYKTCVQREFESFDLEQINPRFNSRLENNIMTLQISEFQGYHLQDFDTEIQMKDCTQKLPKIQSLLLEFQKLSQLIEFKSSFKTEVFQQFLEIQDQLIIDSIPILDYIKGVNIDKKILAKTDNLHRLLNDPDVNRIFQNELTFFLKEEADETELEFFEHRNFTTMSQMFQERLKIYDQFKGYEKLMKNSFKFFSFDKQQYKQLQETFESLISFIQKLNYQKDYISKGIQYFNRDLNICQSQDKIQSQEEQSNNDIQKYTIKQSEPAIQYQGEQQKAKSQKQEESQETKIQKQEEQQKGKIKNQVDVCQWKLQNIEQKINQHSQAIEMNLFIQYGQHYDKIFKDIEKIQENVFTIIENLKKYQQLFEISEKLYQVEIYPTHDAPEDIISVQVYENLLKLQNLIVFLSNSFTKARELLDFDNEDMKSYENQYKDLKKSFKADSYADQKVKKQLNNLFTDYEQCSQNKQKFPGNSEINGQDYSKENNYYWFIKKFIPSFPENLLILPIIVEEFEKDDISNYEKSSESCKANIEGIAEDIIETLKIIELLKYNQSGQKQYDHMISQALSFKKEFIQQAKEFYFEMEKLNLQHKLKYFKVIENQNIDKQLQNQFNKLHSFNDNLGFFAYAYQASIDLLKFNEEDFKQIEENQKLVNNYLRDQQKYQLKDLLNQLEDLYHRYKDCTGCDFLYDFCRSQEEQNIYGGICQNNCIYEPKNLNIIQQDIKIENAKKHKNIHKLHGQKTNHSKIKQKK